MTMKPTPGQAQQAVIRADACNPIKNTTTMRTGCLPWTLTMKKQKKTARSTCTLDPAVSRHAAQDCPWLQFLGPGKGAWFRLAKRSRHLGLPCFALRLGLWRWYQWLWCCQNFGIHFVSSFGPSIYHTARYTIQGCDCMSMQQLSRKKFWMLLPTFFSFFGAPFLGPIFGPHFWCPVPF